MDPPTPVLAAIERNRRRLWSICYRMTGERVEADDLAQEAITRAIERADQLLEEDATGWLVRIATRVCLDHLRRRRIVRRHTELVDPVDTADPGELPERGPEARAILREDVRFALVLALQALSPKQRAALILHDVCDQPLAVVAGALDTNANAAKALVHRARVALAAARVHVDVDVPADRHVVERMAQAIEAGAVGDLAAMLAADAWGVVDGGGVIQTATRPTFGGRAVARQWTNAKHKLGVPVTARVRVLNGEPAIVIRLATQPGVVVAVAHVETRAGAVVALRVHRDPTRIARLADALPVP